MQSYRLAARAGTRHYSLIIRQQSTSAEVVTAPVTSTDEWNNARPFEDIPGPKVLPLIGIGYKFLPKIGEYSGGDFYDLHNKVHSQYGDICRIGGLPNNRSMVIVFKPDWVEKVYRSEGNMPLREGLESFDYYRKVTRKDFFEHAGLVAEQGERWHSFRRKVNQPMMHASAAKPYIGPINNVANEFIDKIYKMRDSNMELPDDFSNELCKWSLESIAVIALDTRLGCLAENLPPGSEPQRMIDSVHVMFDALSKLNFQFPFWKFFSTPTWKRYVESLDYFLEVSTKYIHKAIEESKQIISEEDKSMSVLQKILAKDSNPKTAIIMALDMLMAGVDTTSVAVANLLYQLAKNEDKQEKLAEEISKVICKKEIITEENLEDMKYLKACAKEMFRLSPVVVVNGRTTINDIVIGNYQIKKGTMVHLPHMVLSHKDEYFPEAKKFIPERWLKGNNEREKVHPFISRPFGYGPRTCIGRRFAELELQTLVAKMVQHFKIEYHHGEIGFSRKVVSSPIDPLKFRLIERK